MYRLINPVDGEVIYVGEGDPMHEARKPTQHPNKLTRIIRSLWRNRLHPTREELTDNAYTEEEENQTHAQNTR